MAGAGLDNIDSTAVHPIFRALLYGYFCNGENKLLPPVYCPSGADGPHKYRYVIRRFLERETDINIRDFLGRSMLYLATFQNCEESVILLLSNGADSIAKDSFGQISLHVV